MEDEDGTSTEDMEGSEGELGQPCSGGIRVDYVNNVWRPRFGCRMSRMIVLTLVYHVDTNGKIMRDVKTACNRGKTILVVAVKKKKERYK